MECFVTDLKDIEGRIDPHYYKPSFIRLTDELNERNTVRISDIANVICGPFGSSITLKDYIEEGIPLIRISNIHEDSLIHEDLVFISNEKAKSLNSYKVKENDLIISQRGTLGLTAKVDAYFNGAIISANFIAIKDIKKIQPDYLITFLSSDFGKKQLARQTSGQVQTKITTEDVKRIRVPALPIKLQNQVVDLMQSAYRLTRQKEAEAKKLLDSIDEYIFNEIGLKLEAHEENLSYIVWSNSIEDRLDAHFYKPLFKELEDNLLNMNSLRLGDIITFSRENWNQTDFFTANFPYIEISEVDILTGEIRNVQYIDVTEAPSRARMIVREKDIIVSTTRPNRGAIALIDHERDGFIASTGFAVLRQMKNKNIDSHFLFHLLRTELCLKQMLQRSSGGNYPAITESELQKILIPVPSLQVQHKIVKEVSTRIEKVKEYQQEANVEIDKAKAEVERLILGK